MSFTATTSSLFNSVTASVVRLVPPATTTAATTTATTTAQSESTSPANATTTRKRKTHDTPVSRNHPKRQRQAVSYAEIDSDDELINQSDSDEEYGKPAVISQKKSKKGRPLPKRKIFPFLSLPRELRDIIYEHCLVDPIGGVYLEERTVHYRRIAVRVPKGPQVYMNNHGTCAWMPQWPHISTSPMDDPQPDPHTASLVPALLSVCKQIRSEATSILYAQPLFFEDTCALHGFLSGLTRETRGLLRHITVLSDYHSRSMKLNFDIASLTLLAEGGHNLKSFNFLDFCYRYRYEKDLPTQAARKFYRRAFKFLEVMVGQRGIDEAIEVPQLIGREYDDFIDYNPDREGDFKKELRKLIMHNMRRP